MMRTQQHERQVIILCGGLGTRLGHVIGGIPKALAPIAGRPFLCYLLDRLALENVQLVCLATGYLSNKIEEVIGTEWKGMRIIYSVESESLGTGGALLLALSRIHNKGVHVCNGDTWLNYSLAEIETITANHRAAVGITLAHVPNVERYGAVSVKDDRILSFQEKGAQGSGWINAGNYFLSTKALAEIQQMQESHFSLETDFLYPMTKHGELVACTNTHNFIDIGVPEDYLLAQQIHYKYFSTNNNNK